jgi:hypothetical protein
MDLLDILKPYEVYLAGRIAGLSYEEAMEFRRSITEKLCKQGICCRTPLRGKKFLSSTEHIYTENIEVRMSIQEIIQRDLHDINSCNSLLVITGDDPSWGTGGEFWYATWIAKKPTLVIAKNHPSGWLKHFATRVVDSEDKAMEVLLDWKKYWDGVGVYDLE